MISRPTITLPLNLLDELYLNLDRAQEPWTVHYEAAFGHHLDHDRLVQAIETAAQRHPLARARLTPWRFRDRGYRWEITDRLQDVPLEVVACAERATLEVERERLFSVSPPLAAAPPFSMLLARGPDGDTLMMNLHHAAGDGISAARLMLSITRAYARIDDPIPPIDPLSVHDVRALAAARSPQERATRLAVLTRGAWRSVIPPARVAREGGDDRPAYGFEMVTLSPADTQRLFTRRTQGTTVNDVLLAALAVAIGRWNRQHGHGDHPIALSMPVNLRPESWRHDVVSNFAAWTTVWVRPRPGEDLGDVVALIGADTRAIKRDGRAGLAVDLLIAPGRMTIAAKRWLQYLRVAFGESAVDTASLSNLGRIEALPAELGDATVQFSPPSQMPLGVAIGALTLDERLHVTLRYRHAQFAPAAARRFTELFVDVIAG